MQTSTHAEPVPTPRVTDLAPGRRTAIVVGASSGMGAALVRQLAGEGFRVVALARRAGALAALAESCAAACAASGGAVLTREHDTRDTAAVEALFEPLVRELGGLELLVYAAGIMPPIAPTQYDTALDLDIMAVNFGGCVAWCNQAANLFRTQRSGTIIGISSISGDRGRKGNPAYGASKAAMNHYLEALRNRLGEHGVHVCTIKPGYVDTAMTQGMQGLFWLISPEQAARTILRAARGRSNVRYVPLRWTAVGVTLRLIPSVLFRKLSI